MSHEAEARAILMQVIADNQVKNFVGLDRSAEAIIARRKRMNVGGGKDKNKSKFGHILEEHMINGDITSEQSAKILLVLYGLA